MKATGIVRRIDDLGRVVIPKEIRRTLRIREGDPLEIFTEKDGEVIFKKYSPMGELQNFATQICESVARNTGHIAVICDRDCVIAVHGAPKKELLDKRNSQELDRILTDRRAFRYMAGEKKVPLTDGEDKYFVGVAVPILSEGDLMGGVLLLVQEQDAPLGEAQQQLAQTVAGFLGRQMEN
ncbi:MAG: AbrB/MazE/SpoVT family DNA-binding domain-containing protein [Oscillospiraceae bacterium]|nr:AbrB/MazE/SpoVT family DNA-binding domain-containing protein [Oscillospiraceae bacterium]